MFLRRVFVSICEYKKLNKFNICSTKKISKMFSEENKIHLKKPLNLLIYLDENILQKFSKEEKKKNDTIAIWIQNSNVLFQLIKDFLFYYFNQEYTIYPITLEGLEEKEWFNITKLLIVIHDSKLSNEEFLNQHSFNLLNSCSKNGNLIIFSLKQIIFDELDLSNLKLNKNSIKMLINEKFGNDISNCKEIIPKIETHFLYSKLRDLELKNNKLINFFLEKNIPFKLCKNLNDVKCNFDIDLYYKYLDNHDLGKNIIVTNITESTQPIAENINLDNLLIFSNQQLNGKGRGGNQWISPNGSISFTFTMQVHKNCILFNDLGFVQHISSLAIILAIKSFNNCKNLNIKIKWPNDIYWKSEYKIIGILVNSKLEDGIAKFFVGYGVNLNNHKPNFCLNDAVNLDNNKSENEYEKNIIKKEILVARTINQMNSLINIFNNNQKNKILELYYENWMLSNKYIRLNQTSNAKIVGLNEDGYLEGELDTGEIVSLYPDGNKYDILKNLVIYNPKN